MEKKMKQTIREILGKHGGLPVPVDTLADDADLYAAGLSSFASVQVMLGIEDAFDVEFPDNLLNRKSFPSIDAITRAVSGLVGSAEAAE
jgi:acyl carrier protein